MVAGGTGATEKQLDAAGIPYLRAQIHPSGHAGYYPGTAQMDSQGACSRPMTGKVLGAQIVGFDGVDKRLDVLATALRGGMTVYDLEKLELAYAPPFGSAKDPVNMIGFVASNMLRGDLRLVVLHATTRRTTEGARIIDVRGPSEFDDLAPARRGERAAERPCAMAQAELGPRHRRSGCTAPSGSAATWPTGSWSSAASPT